MSYQVDGDGRPLDTSKHDYTLNFGPGQLPPVNAFWSLTMYDGKTRLMVDNRIDRYLINSAMLDRLKKNGSVDTSDESDSQHLRINPDQRAPARGEHAGAFAADVSLIRHGLATCHLHGRRR